MYLERALKLLSDFYPRILPYVVGCPDPVAEQALRDTAISFCDSTMVIHEQLTAFNTMVSTAEYTLSAPSADETVSRVLEVSVDGRAIRPIPSTDAFGLLSQSGAPVYFYTTRVGSQLKLVLYPTPDKAYTIAVDAALRPTRTATQVQDDLYNQWIDTLAAGAVSRIASMPGQSFTDMQLAAFKQSEFYTGVTRARIDGRTGRLKGSARVTLRPFA